MKVIIQIPCFNEAGTLPQTLADLPRDETPIPVREHLKLARERLKLNYLFWSASPRECLANVKRMLAEPDLAGDPAGGLVTALPARAFARPS